ACAAARLFWFCRIRPAAAPTPAPTAAPLPASPPMAPPTAPTAAPRAAPFTAPPCCGGGAAARCGGAGRGAFHLAALLWRRCRGRLRRRGGVEAGLLLGPVMAVELVLL